MNEIGLQRGIFGAIIQIEKSAGQRAEQVPERMALQPTGGIAEYFGEIYCPNHKGENESSPRGLDEKIVDEKLARLAQAIFRPQRGKNHGAKNITPQRRIGDEQKGEQRINQKIGDNEIFAVERFEAGNIVQHDEAGDEIHAHHIKELPDKSQRGMIKCATQSGDDQRRAVQQRIRALARQEVAF